MTLVSSGILNLKGSSAAPTRSIEFECEGNYTGDFSLTTAQGIASAYVGSLPTDMTDFYGYTAGSTIVVDFSEHFTWAINTPGDKDGYQELTITGRQPGDKIVLNLHLDFVESSGAVVCSVYSSINSSVAWLLKDSFTETGSGDYTIVDVDYNETVRVRVDITAIKSGSGYITATLTGGTFTTGSGTITASGTIQWYVEVIL